MPLQKPNELDFSSKKVAILITARPGVGKTTLAESASRPLLIDLEDGIDRVDACYRKDRIIDATYEDFKKDIETLDFSDYDTVIVDSIGKLIDLMTPFVIKQNSVNAQKDGKTLSLKGYGAVSTEVSNFIKSVENKGKDIVFIAHVTESQDKDGTIKTRVNIPGSTKDRIWDDIDLGCYVEFNGKQRIAHFTPSESWDAKGTHGIYGDYAIPELKSTGNGGNPADNHFLADLLDKVRSDLAQSKKEYEENSKIYNEAMKILPEIEGAKNVDELNAVVAKLSDVKHALTSHEELLAAVTAKADKLGASYDRKARKYVIVAEETKKAPVDGKPSK